jgi:competence protein ComEC
MWYFPERPHWVLLLASIGALLWVVPIAPLRAAGLALCVPLLIVPNDKLEPGTFELAVLDVGQGLAVVIRTHSHTLIYDTGPAFRSGKDAGELAVIPYLHHVGSNRSDLLMLSHGDLDHVGGAKSVLTGITVERVLQGPSVSLLARDARTCLAGQKWQWDGIEFAVLHPSDPHETGRNNSSCVLEIRNAGGRALIMGDVERESELALIERDAISRSDIVVAAHHGSRTSSTPPFVAATHASYVVFSAGWNNRWGFPKPDVVQRWQEQGAKTYTTFGSGAIEFIVTPAGIRRISEYRVEHGHYWSAVGVDSNRAP